MSSVRIVNADELRANVRFEDLIEPISRAFQEFSAGLAHNGLFVMVPAERPDLGDVYVKTGTLRRHPIFIVKISPWFTINQERGHAQGGFIGIFDSLSCNTQALINEYRVLSDYR